MYEFMTEMQTLAFRELEPDAYQSISKRLEQLHKGGGDLIGVLLLRDSIVSTMGPKARTKSNV